MLKPMFGAFRVALLLAAAAAYFTAAPAHARSTETKEWTFLTYLNGNNNLDPYGAVNINQMELVGSSDQVNIVVQWASESAGSTRRLYITRDPDRKTVRSPVLQELHALDMGDWRNLVEFVRWGIEHYPAKRIFVNIWSHGTGWREPEMQRAKGFSPFDISPDDLSGNAISTRELGMAMQEIARITGRKVDLYGSDACLMSMIEIAAEVADSVETFVGSQATEPGDGWPYEKFLSEWQKAPQLGAHDLAKLLTRTYYETYAGNSGPKKDATLSALDLRQMPRLMGALHDLSVPLQSLALERRRDVLRAIRNSLQFTLTDYVDLGDFLGKLEAVDPNATYAIDPVQQALSALMVSNDVTGRYSRASGLSIWIPDNGDLLDRFGKEYERLKFHAGTRWGDALKLIAQPNAP